MEEDTKAQCTTLLRVVFIALEFLLLWIRFVATGGTATDNAGQAMTGIFTSWVLSHLITHKSFWLEIYRWGTLMTTMSIVHIIAAVDAATLTSGTAVSLDYAIVVNITMLATLEVVAKWKEAMTAKPAHTPRAEHNAYSENLLNEPYPLNNDNDDV